MNKKLFISFFLLNVIFLLFTAHSSVIYAQTIGFQCLNVNIEILQQNGVDEASQVKVSQWQNAFSGTAPNNVNFNENFVSVNDEDLIDEDRFFIRINDPAKAGQGSISCNITTYGKISNGFTNRDRITNIILQEDPTSPGNFVSIPVVLVSNTIDDNYDEQPGESDQTINIFSEDLESDHENTRTDGFILVEYDFETGSGPVEGSTQIVNCSLDICKQKTIKVRIFTINETYNGTPLISLQKMREEVAKMNLIWAQSCIQVEIIEERIVNPPQKETFTDSGYEFEGEILGAGDNKFSFKDFGEDGEEGTFDRGEGDEIHTFGEPGEVFSDSNGNHVYDDKVNFTGGVLDFHPLFFGLWSAISGEERHLIDTYSDSGEGSSKTIEFFGIVDFDPNFVRGKSFQASGPMGPFLRDPNQIIVRDVVLGLGPDDPFTGAHELGHVILQDANHEPNAQVLGHINLMRLGTSGEDGLTESKRLNNQQVTTALSF